MASKGVDSAKTVVVYGDGADDAATLVARLQALGYADVRTLAGGFAAWAADDRLPVESLPNCEKLVFPQWLEELAYDIGSLAPTDRQRFVEDGLQIPGESEADSWIVGRGEEVRRMIGALAAADQDD